MKKIISILMAFSILICSLSAFAISAQAATYNEKLKSKGFPDSYISYLVELHNKYPKWNFEPLKTGLDFQDAVDGESSQHSNQLIQKCSSFTTDYYCNCSSCYKNDSYVIREGSTWVSASESAVKYYMDPRNWLTEKYIFQFESTAYDESQTQSGVESILSGSFMHNSTMTYLTTGGKTKTYAYSNGTKPKYSATIIKAAKNSGLSAYYLASKIVEEVGGSNMTATGVCGDKLPFTGLYNFYDIGATANGTQGLEWASGYIKTTTEATLYSSYDSDKKKGSGTKTDVSVGQYMAYMGEYGDYYKVRLYTTNGSAYTTGKVGYILKSTLRTTYLNYGRPWTNPYRSIYYGAEYIATSFSKYQNTSYLQKFNVNPDSGMLHHHEYMKAVYGAANEAALKYKAYKNSNNLSAARTFYIPVYKNMPSTACKVISTQDVTTTVTTESSKVTGLKLTSRASTSLTYKWSSVKNADEYYIYIKDNSNGDVIKKTTSDNKYKITGLSKGHQYTVKVKAHISSKGWAAYSSSVTNRTLPKQVSSLKVKSKTSTKIKLSWSKVAYCSGYKVYRKVDGKYKLIKTIKGSSNTTYTVTNLSSGLIYNFKVCAYVTENDKKYNGSKSSALSAVTTLTKDNNLKLSCPEKNKIKASWSKVDCEADGYQIVFAHDEDFKDVVATRIVEGKKTNTYTGKNLNSKQKYYIRVRAFRKVGSKYYYGYWSKVQGITCK